MRAVIGKMTLNRPKKVIGKTDVALNTPWFAASNKVRGFPFIHRAVTQEVSVSLN